MSHGKVCCNCNHCIRSRDDKYNIIICRCDVHDMYLSYASVMGGCCKHWTKKQEGEETGGRVMIQWCEDCKHNYNHNDDWPNDLCEKCIEESEPCEIPTKYEAEGE